MPMTTFGIVVVGLLMLIGLTGVVVPVIPGLLLILGAATAVIGVRALVA